MSKLIQMLEMRKAYAIAEIEMFHAEESTEKDLTNPVCSTDSSDHENPNPEKKDSEKTNEAGATKTTMSSRADADEAAVESETELPHPDVCFADTSQTKYDGIPIPVRRILPCPRSRVSRHWT